MTDLLIRHPPVRPRRGFPTPRPDQAEVLAKLERVFRDHDRAQAVMACGSGKTFISRWHAERSQAHCTLVLLPSLSLITQFLREWRRAGNWPFDALVVCSDPSTAAGADKSGADDVADGLDLLGATQRAPVTTSAQKVSHFLTTTSSARPQVVFCTYHSLPVIRDAQRIAANQHRDAGFDLLVADEAHHLGGRPREDFRLALNPHAILARKRLFMTATPYITSRPESLSMSDERIFGPIAARLTFSAAIAQRLLTDYQVAVIADRSHDNRAGLSEGSQLLSAVMAAVQQHGLRRIISFHGRVDKAAAFATALVGKRLPDGRLLRARHLSGDMLAEQRAHALSWLANDDPEEVRVVSNAHCLAEGVDVPAVDGVVFADPLSSMTRIIQAVGRVMRPAPGKQIGTIVVPVALSADGDDDSTLLTGPFAHVWSVLRALRAHDERLAADMDRAKSAHSRRGTAPARLSRVSFVLPGNMDEASLRLRLVQEVGSQWAAFYGLLQDYADRHEGRVVPWQASWRGAPLGNWCEQQRVAYREKRLPADRARLLEQVPGWTWEREDGYWQQTLKILTALARERGTLLQDPAEPSIYDGLKAAENRHLGPWVARQRQLYRDEMLSRDRTRQLAALPGWRWDGGLPADDVAMIQALRLFCEFEHHADVGEAHMENGLPLGRWVWAVRRRKLTGRLHPALEEEIIAATPYTANGEPSFRWQVSETRWRLAYSALQRYARREGHATPPSSQIEELPDGAIHLGRWTTRQRHLYRKGRLDPQLATWLNAVPGWKWEVPLTRVEYGEPLDLGGHPHGTAKGIAAHCPCELCLDARRTRDRERLAQQRQLVDPVPAGPAQRHVQHLETSGAKRTAIQVASSVPLGVIRTLLKGECEELERSYADSLLATTLDMCTARMSQAGSRGRTTNPDNERIDIQPTLTLLDDLASRGFNRMWVARELGYAGGLQLNKHVITRRLANAIAALHTRVGDLRVPGPRRNHRIPPLAELLDQHSAHASDDRTATMAPSRRRPRPYKAVLMTGDKHCPRCGTTCPRTNFYRNPDTVDLLSPWCKPCHNEIGFRPVV
ncbi:Helicase associated domain protein (plasmid) [Nonomuraea sp. NBC_00507]